MFLYSSLPNLTLHCDKDTLPIMVAIKLFLTRNESSDEGTFGVLSGPGLKLFTGELPWKDNVSNVSCIPPGTYNGTWTYSARFRRNVYLVSPVTGRTGIRIHSANLMGTTSLGFKAQLNGCIALGEKLGWIEGQKAILLSRPAVTKFESLLAGKPFILEIK